MAALSPIVSSPFQWGTIIVRDILKGGERSKEVIMTRADLGGSRVTWSNCSYSSKFCIRYIFVLRLQWGGLAVFELAIANHPAHCHQFLAPRKRPTQSAGQPKVSLPLGISVCRCYLISNIEVNSSIVPRSRLPFWLAIFPFRRVSAKWLEPRVVATDNILRFVYHHTKTSGQVCGPKSKTNRST
jgi:hypothetical protein